MLFLFVFLLQANVFFFLVTVYKLAEKFSSLNPDLHNLRKIRYILTRVFSFSDQAHVWTRAETYQFKTRQSSIWLWAHADIRFVGVGVSYTFVSPCRTFTITAVAQLAILGIMWIFGCFQFNESTMAVSYIFVFLNCLQGVLMFVMHCLLNKQVSASSIRQSSKTTEILNARQHRVTVWLAVSFHSAVSFIYCWQVREDYGKFLACICSPHKPKYSDFSSNQSKSQVLSSRLELENSFSRDCVEGIFLSFFLLL